MNPDLEKLILREQELLKELTEIQTIRASIEERILEGTVLASDINDLVPLDKTHIEAKIEALARQIILNHQNDNLILLSVLEGAKPFSSALEKAITLIDPTFKYYTSSLTTSSYKGTTAGDVKIYELSDKIEYTNRVTLILDEVCDTGNTLLNLIKRIEEEAPKAIYTAVLVDKNQPRMIQEPGLEPKQFDPNYVGFTLSKKAFIVGWGLDYNEAFRHLLDIKVVNTKTLPTEAEQIILANEKPLAIELKQVVMEKKKLEKLIPLEAQVKPNIMPKSPTMRKNPFVFYQQPTLSASPPRSQKRFFPQNI